MGFFWEVAKDVVSGLGEVVGLGGSSEPSKPEESSANKGWQSSNTDSSAMKVTSDKDSYRVESISDEKYPHEHVIYEADKNTGTTEQVWVGENYIGSDGKRGT